MGTPRAGIPDPVGRHLLVLARDPEGYGRLCRVISAAHLAGGEKGRPVYDLAELAEAHDGHWVILTGCRKGTVPRPCRGWPGRGAGGSHGGRTRSDPWRGAAELRALTEMFGRDNVMVELINNDQPGDDERNDALFELARQERAWRGRLEQRPSRRARRREAGAGARRDQGAQQPGRHGRLAGRVGDRVHQDRGRDGATGCAGTPACWSGPSNSRRSARSTSR